jgi:serine/threonine-protein kinase
MQELQYLTKFRILTEIAVGGMGAVYLAEQIGVKNFRKTVAIKTIRTSLIADEETLEMFLGEARLVADLIHENIVQVYQLGESDGMYYVIMEYAGGPNLETFMVRHKFMKKSVPVDIAAFIVSRIARGLDYAHKKRDYQGKRLKIVHRDVSPSNIIITYQGGVKLTDFGIAKALNMKVPDEHEVIMGKYSYMSPEQVRCEGTDLRSDIFSLGLVAYELFTGKIIYDVDDGLALLEALKKPVPYPHLLNSAVPPALSAIIMKAIAHNPDDRYASAKEMQEKLEYFLCDSGFSFSNETLAKYVELLFPEARKKQGNS